jgi:hypothetical protein
MELSLLWQIVVTLVILPIAWYIKSLSSEVQRIQILLNMTREDYMKRKDHSEENGRILDHLRRLEDKIDRLSERGSKSN